MESPLLLFGGLSTHAVTAPFGGALASFTRPMTLKVGYEAGDFWRSALPDFNTGLQAYVNGLWSDAGFTSNCAYNNISLVDSGNGKWEDECSKFWINTLPAFYHQLNPWQVIEAFLRGVIPDATLRSMLGHHKFRQDHVKVATELIRERFTMQDIFALWNRGSLDQDGALRELKRSFPAPDTLIDKIKELRKQIPPASELVRFLVRHVWEPDIRNTLGLDDEYDRVSKAIPWFNAIGMFDGMKLPGMADNDAVDFIKAEWATHWQNMSPGQMFVAHQRIRPGREKKWGQFVPTAGAFTDDVLNKALRMDDYVPKMREWLTAISYNVIPFRQLKQLYTEEVIDKTELTEQLKDTGYVQSDADLIANLLEKQKQESEDKSTENKLIAETIASYKIGAITFEMARSILANTYLKERDYLMLLSIADAQINRAKVNAYIKMVKSEFELGLYTGPQAHDELVQGGVTDAAANNYVQLWQRKLSRPRRVANTEKLIKWYIDGFINALDLTERLTKLGWANADQLLYLAEANEKIQENIAKQLAMQARTERQAEQAARRLAAEAAAQHNRMIVELNRHSSPTMMKTWFKDGLIDVGTIETRLAQMDWPLDDIARFVAEIQQ